MMNVMGKEDDDDDALLTAKNNDDDASMKSSLRSYSKVCFE